MVICPQSRYSFGSFLLGKTSSSGTWKIALWNVPSGFPIITLISVTDINRLEMVYDLKVSVDPSSLSLMSMSTAISMSSLVDSTRPEFELHLKVFWAILSCVSEPGFLKDVVLMIVCLTLISQTSGVPAMIDLSALGLKCIKIGILFPRSIISGILAMISIA